LIGRPAVRYSAQKTNKKRKSMSLARADLESLLRRHKLDRTLTSTLPPLDPSSSAGRRAVAATGVSAIDHRLGGGFPCGQLSEIVGPRSSGRASLLLQILAAATARGELVALVDALDMFDVESASRAGIECSRLLWIRGHAAVSAGFCRDSNQRSIEQAIRALGLVLSAGNFGLVAFDAGEAPPDALKRLPFTTWLRLQRLIEGGQTACVLVGSEPMARSTAGVTVTLGQARGGGQAGDVRLFQGLDITLRVIHARPRVHEDTTVALATAASGHD
jgi:hypothetical protein